MTSNRGAPGAGKNGNGTSGLKLLLTGAERTRKAPTPDSKTQRRKAELKSYNAAELKGGRARKAVAT